MTLCAPLRFWSCQSGFNAPARFEPVGKRLWPQSKLSCPLSYRLGSTISSQSDVFLKIVGLCFSVRPSAVFGRVAQRVIDPIKGAAFRSLTHISKKGIERLRPALADGDASAPIAVEIFGVWVGASSPHGFPCAVFSGFDHSVSADDLNLVTPTRCCMAGPDAAPCDDNNVAAITPAIPFWVSGFGVFRSGDNGKSVELLAGKINKCRHFLTSIMVNNHWRARSNEVIDVSLSPAKTSYACAF